MMTTSLSTIDSTYMSITKVVSLELFGFATKCRPLSPRDAAVGQHNILIGRISIILLGIAGVAYLHMDNAEVIQATTGASARAYHGACEALRALTCS
jgi:hypothetical protein